jgi:hypothetical protein
MTLTDYMMPYNNSREPSGMPDDGPESLKHVIEFTQKRGINGDLTNHL